MQQTLLSEIHLFHTSNIYLPQYPIIVKSLRRKIDKQAELEIKNLNTMLKDNKITIGEYIKLKEIIEFKNTKYNEMIYAR